MSNQQRKELKSLLTDKNGVTIKSVNIKTDGPPEKREPVRLTPAWEATNVPDDELNFRNINMEDAHLQLHPPKDRWKMVYFVLLLHGVGVLMPWNMFITAKSYFIDYKLSENYTGIQTPYAQNFMAYIGFAAQVPNVLFNWANIFIQFGGSFTPRIVWSITVEAIMFIFTVILAMSNSQDWPDAFFWITIVSVIIINIANGIYQNTVYGMAAKLPSEYTGVVVLGSNISGTFVTVISIISEFFSPNSRTAAIYYFITALFVLLMCFDTYFALPLNRFYRYHELRHIKATQQKKRENAGVIPRIPYWYVFKQAAPQLLNVFMVFFITLSIFPAIHSNIMPSDPDFFVSDRFYTSFTCFLTFNVCAMLGSLLTTWIKWPKPQYVWIPVFLRILYIPFFLLCNYLPPETNRVLPVVINSDWAYWIVAITMGLSSGYLSSLSLIYTPTTVEPVYAGTAGMFGAAMLITGIFAGVLFSFLGPPIIENISF